MKSKQIFLDIPDVDQEEVNKLIEERSSAEPIVPEFVEEKDIRKPEDYNRFRDLDSKAEFRNKLIDTLYSEFLNHHDATAAKHLIDEFKKLADSVEKNGAAIFGNLIDTENFQELVKIYTQKLATDGSKTWIHSYVNFCNHPDFLGNDKFNGAFIHPLLVSLISYAVGGPIRIVDARGKDAEPLAVQAQDNMLHIDNTPFRKEFKVIVTWERGKASGPKGQNFVFIPGTNKGVRNCKIGTDGKGWSTEDGSIFTTPEAVQTVFDLQKKLLGKSPAVVEATHPDMPLSTVFEAGALIHHRYRTKEKNVPRSCIIVAFHRAQDNPGQLLSSEHLNKFAKEGSLLHLMMGKHSDDTEERFLKAITQNCNEIAHKIEELGKDQIKGSKILQFTNKMLDEEELKKWKKTVTAAPTVEQIKNEREYFHLGQELTKDLLTEMMKYDKHGPIDLILYADGHEEIRKWARNRIREMPLTRLEYRLDKFSEWNLLSTPNKNDLLTPAQLEDIAKQLLKLIDGVSDEVKEKANLDASEKISRKDAYRSVRQLIEDLGESIVRCTSRQTFLSTSLFLFWASDELSRLLSGTNEPPKELLDLSGKLLANYISTYIIIEKQIKMEKGLEKEPTLVEELKETQALEQPSQRLSQSPQAFLRSSQDTSTEDTKISPEDYDKEGKTYK